MKDDVYTLERSVSQAAIQVYSTSQGAAGYVAQHIAALITTKEQQGQAAVLGLATGNTPIEVYKALVNMHKNEGLSFRNVITFNLDEYYPMAPEHGQSYRSFMNANLFNHVDIDIANTHIPDGTLPLPEVEPYCLGYEKKIHQCGGLDLQLLGIGRTGHIGFNEPGSALGSPTRLVCLNQITIQDAATTFGGAQNVPSHAITMGVETISRAREIILLGLGQHKAHIIQKAIQGKITPDVPASYLQKLSKVKYILDQQAASELAV